jgi:hypothetical protein
MVIGGKTVLNDSHGWLSRVLSSLLNVKPRHRRPNRGSVLHANSISAFACLSSELLSGIPPYSSTHSDAKNAEEIQTLKEIIAGVVLVDD